MKKEFKIPEFFIITTPPPESDISNEREIKNNSALLLVKKVTSPGLVHQLIFRSPKIRKLRHQTNQLKEEKKKSLRDMKKAKPRLYDHLSNDSRSIAISFYV